MFFEKVRDFFYKNRFFLSKDAVFEFPHSAGRDFKKVKIKIKKGNNRFVIGRDVEISNCEIRISGQGNVVEIGDNVRFSSGKIYLINAVGQHIKIGSDTTIEGCYLLVDEQASVDIGKDCMLSTDIIIRTGDKHSIIDDETGERINHSKDIFIGDRVWIGRDVTVLKGTVLKPETIVATRSLVSRVFDEGHCVVAGIPAKIVKRGVHWSRDLL